MSSAQTRRQAFTIVEILIVVVILGILAAIVIPQFSRAGESAKASSLISQTVTVRGQIMLYQVEHKGTFPDLGQDHGQGTIWAQLTMRTNADGEIGTTDEHHLGPYLYEQPRNPFNMSSAVTQGTGAGLPAATGDEGWVYNRDTGQIRAVVTQAQMDENNFSQHDVVVVAGE